LQIYTKDHPFCFHPLGSPNQKSKNGLKNIHRPYTIKLLLFCTNLFAKYGIKNRKNIMELKNKLVVYFVVILSISLSAVRADEFKAEGLTEPVKKGSREYSAKVT